VDNTQLSVPGYRDRVAHVLLDETEGGLNLNMPEDVIENLSTRGQLAARELARRFDPVQVPKGMPLTWDNHRWVRLRSSMQLLEEFLHDIRDQYRVQGPGGRSYEDLVRRTTSEPPGSYRWPNQAAKGDAEAALEELQALKFLQAPARVFKDEAPRPTPELRIRPRL
jgi:hypothetical protein